MRVKLIVTGDMERLAMIESLRRFFPRDIAGNPVDYLPPRKVNGITANPLSLDGRSTSPLALMARSMVAEVEEGAEPDRKGADLVVAIEDLELANFDQPATVVECVRRAVREDIDSRVREGQLGSSAEDKLRKRIRERCSFHLLAPMTEAYFFGGDRNPLGKIAPGCHPRLVRPDVEDFETDDPGYRKAVAGENERRWALGHRWWRHERHPKHYLEHLAWKSGTDYHETTNGKDALKGIDWNRVPPDENSVCFLRSLFRDLADFFGVESPLGPGEPSPHTYPGRDVDRRTLVLRNI